MRLRHTLTRLQPKLLLSYLLVLAIGLGGAALSVRVLAPPIFDQLLTRHMGAGADMMGGGMSDTMRHDTLDVFRAAITQTLAFGTIAATLAAFGVSVFVSRRITAPIEQMAEASERIAHGDYRARVDRFERDEIGALAGNLNLMAARLEETERRRAHLIGDVAHEIRTPLATLVGYLEGLLDGVIEPTPELFGQLRDEAGRLTRLVDDLQELSRVEAGSVMLSPRVVPPRRIVEAALARVAPQFAEKGVDLRAADLSALPDVRADEDRVIQVLTNLLVNALRHTPAGGTVDVAASAVNGMAQFSVTDTGSGIPAEHLPHIFERFYRVDPSRARAHGGSGIGLTIARALVVAQGGEIRAESDGPGRGSVFTFTLPQAR